MGRGPVPLTSCSHTRNCVDIVWKDQVQPLLLKRFPTATSAQLRQAHAYAYGGCLIQDIGYYPFGSKFFSDLTHYVRTGDFITNLLRESTDLDQYAFALGALAHYSSDNSGPPLINRAVALVFPKLRAKYGESVTYEDAPRAHIRTEFGFDTTQVAKNRYSSDQYHDFIGFKVSEPLLERAFLDTYGLHLEEVLTHVDLAIGTFRFAVGRVIPEMTRAALTVHHPEMVTDPANHREQQFLFNLSRAQYEKERGKEYRKPGFLTRVLGFVLRWVPKIGALKTLDFKIPSTETEDLYFKSMNQTVENYGELLHRVDGGNLHLPNNDCDTGRPTRLGEYGLGDETHAWLLDQLFKRGFGGAQPDVRESLLAFYDSAPPAKANPEDAKSLAPHHVRAGGASVYPRFSGGGGTARAPLASDAQDGKSQDGSRAQPGVFPDRRAECQLQVVILARMGCGSGQAAFIGELFHRGDKRHGSASCSEFVMAALSS